MATEIKLTLPQIFEGYEVFLASIGVHDFDRGLQFFREIQYFLRLPYRSLKNKFLTEDLSARDLNAEYKIFKKMFH